jgi:hypothetical protein
MLLTNAGPDEPCDTCGQTIRTGQLAKCLARKRKGYGRCYERWSFVICEMCAQNRRHRLLMLWFIAIASLATASGYIVSQVGNL